MSMRRKFYTILRENTKSLAIVSEDAPMVALQPAGERPPFFIVDSFPFFIDVVQLTGTDQPVLSLIGYEETQDENYTIADEADEHIKTILARQPHGPYMLGGCSASGIVAYEIAQRLHARGHQVGLLVLFDAPNPYFMREYSDFWMSVNSYRNRSEHDAMARDSGMDNRQGPRTEGTQTQMAADFEWSKSHTQYFGWAQVFDGANTCGSNVPSCALLRKGSVGQARKQSRRTLSRSEFRLGRCGSERN